MKRFLLAVSIGVLAVIGIVAHSPKVSAQGYPSDAFNLQDSWNLTWGVKKVGIYASSVSNYMRVFINNTDMMSVTTTGVGIGTNSPTNTLSVSGNANVTGTLTVTGASTFTAPLSSFTVTNATGSYTQTTLASCVNKSTVSLTLTAPVSTIWITYSGASSSTIIGSTVAVGVLIDGAYATIAGVAETSSKGILSVGQGQANGNNDFNMSFGPLPISGLAAGSHNLCLLLSTSGGTATIDTVNEISAFSAYFIP